MFAYLAACLRVCLLWPSCFGWEFSIGVVFVFIVFVVNLLVVCLLALRGLHCFMLLEF